MSTRIPANVFEPRTITLGLTSFDRRAIEEHIEELVSLLDELDGDPDFEDDELHDDPLDLGEGTKDVGPAVKYGIDQSKGYIGVKGRATDCADRRYLEDAVIERLGFRW